MHPKFISTVMLATALAIPASASAQDSLREPEAMAALNEMGTSLRALTDVSVHADMTVEDVLQDGQKLQYSGTIDITAHRPDKFRIDLDINDSARQLFYDGKTLTLYAPQLKYYAKTQAPATIRETLAAAFDKYGLDIPLADLFTWGDDPELVNSVQQAMELGPERIGGHVCHHYAMRQERVDWQVWIRDGEAKLPCKLIITDRSDPSMPQVTAVYDWKSFDPTVTDEFTFVAPVGAMPIKIEQMHNATAQAGE